jgi:NitT/TauT family transport system substrate-binding protein
MTNVKLARSTFLVVLLAAFALCFTLLGCASNNSDQKPDLSEYAEEADALRIGSMKGPTSIGLADMMQQDQGEFTVVGAADELTPLLLQDQIDIALVPANVAAVLYARTEGQIQVIDVNTLGVLYGISADENISNIEDFRGRTVYMTGKGSVPEYTFMALLDAAGISEDELTIEFCSEPTEVVAQITKQNDAIGILPQPYATACTLKNENLHTVLDLTESWAEITGGQKGDMVTGVTVAKTSTIQDHEGAIELFLQRHEASTEVAVNDPSAIVAKVVELGIIENETLAEKAIPNCNVVCYTGEEMKEALSGYLDALFQQNAAALGGSMPGDDFYFLPQN